MDKKTILIVEDDGILTTHMQDMLARLGYTALAPAATGEAAIEAVKAQPPDLVLMDIKLCGEMNGIAAAGLIQSIANVPIVYLSGYSQDSLLQQAKVTAPYGYLVKPVVERELVATIEMALYKHTLDRRLQESEERYHSLYVDSRDAIMMLSPDRGFLTGNPATIKMFACRDEQDFTTRTLASLSPEYQPDGAASADKAQEMMRLAMEKGFHFFEWTHRRADGTDFPATVLLSRLERSDTHLLQATVRDITERKRAEEQVKASLAEKEVLLKEIHHRVKNNLQVISSLLRLQSQHINDKRDQEIFKECQNRVKSMALVHEKLYQSRDLAKIDFAEYVHNLVAHVLRSYQASLGNVGLKVNVGTISFNIDLAIPLGLLINELVSNCLKHAFPDERKGEIQVGLHPDGRGQYVLTVSDNGTGFPGDVDFRNAETLGLQLVNTLTGQLGGAVEIFRNEGTEFRITFPV